MISSTPEKTQTKPSKKRPRIASDEWLDTEAISELSDLTPIKEDNYSYNDSKSDSDSNGYAIFPSFTDVDLHRDSLMLMNIAVMIQRNLPFIHRTMILHNPITMHI